MIRNIFRQREFQCCDRPFHSHEFGLMIELISGSMGGEWGDDEELVDESGGGR